MRVLALDLSSSTGFAVFEGEMNKEPTLKEHGLVVAPKTVKEYGPYPWSIYRATWEQSTHIVEIFNQYRPDVVVIEETNLGRNRYSQKYLEMLHGFLLRQFDVIGNWLYKNPAPAQNRVVYLSTSTWRKQLGLSLSSEQRKSNRHLTQARSKARVNGEIDRKLLNIEKKKVGVKKKYNWKDVAIEAANARYGLSLRVQTQDDVADAILLGTAFFLGATPCDGK